MSKIGELLGIEPSFLFDFEKTRKHHPAMTCLRAAAATSRVNSAVSYYGNDLPRMWTHRFDPNRFGLLQEAAKTNILPNSGTFYADWSIQTPAICTVASPVQWEGGAGNQATIAVSRTHTSAELTPGYTNTKAPALTGGRAYCFSGFIRNNGGANSKVLVCSHDWATAGDVTMTFQFGVKQASLHKSFYPVFGDWWRFEVVFIPTVTGTGNSYVGIYCGHASGEALPAGGWNVTVAGLQLEDVTGFGSASSPIYNNAASMTRAADVINFNLGNRFGANGLTAALKIGDSGALAGRLVQFGNNATPANATTYATVETTDGANYSLKHSAYGVLASGVSTNSNSDAPGVKKIIFSLSNTRALCNLNVNGNSLTPTAGAALAMDFSALTAFNFGLTSAGTVSDCSILSKLVIIPTALTAAQQAALSKIF